MIYEHLQKYAKIGAQNAVSLQELSRRLSVKPTTLKRIVRNERRNGALICSNIDGYFIPENRAEIAECYETMRRTAISRLETVKVFKAALREQEGQQELFRGVENG